ncbi:TPR repeat protein [Entamoeba marina]
MDTKQLSEAAKQRGTQAFKEKNYEVAITEYTEAIKYDNTNAVLYSNRSACYASLDKFEDALSDAELAVKNRPNWARGYSRKAFALFKLNRMDEAEKAAQEGLKIEPTNQMLNDLIEEIKEQQQPQFNPAEMFNNWRFKLMANPRTAGWVNDPQFVQKMETIASDPTKLQLNMEDTRITEALMVLMGINPNNFKTDGSDTKMEEEPPKKEETKQKMEEEPPKKEEQKMEEEPEIDENKKNALAEKQKGNDFYKKKMFNEALECYDKAIELDPTDLTFKLNKTAVFLESERYDECIELCEKIIEEYKELRVYTQLAKLYMRIGNAYYKQNNYTEAETYYKKSCTEHRTAEILDKIKLAEKKKEEKAKQEYFSVEKGDEERKKGTALFKEQNFPEAIKCYTEALKRNPNDHLSYSNRAACYQKLGEHSYAIKDADKCIEIKPDFIKGYNRKGFSHYCMKEYHKALAEYEKALKIDSSNQEALSGISTVQNAIMGGNASSNETDEERYRHAMADPEIQNIINDPTMRKVLEDMSQNPSAAMKYMADPEIRTRIEKLIAAGIIKTG